jgi:hypothetical protein
MRRPRWRAQANQDFLPVFAAGNLGESELPSSLSSPAVAKNCLAVGAPRLYLVPRRPHPSSDQVPGRRGAQHFSTGGESGSHRPGLQTSHMTGPHGTAVGAQARA